MKAVFFPHSLNTEIFKISDLHQNQQDSICTQFFFSNTYKYKENFINEILFVLPVLNFIITFFFPPLIGTPAVDDEVSVQLHSGYFFRQLKMKFILSNIVSSEFCKLVQTLCAYYEFLLDHNLQCSQKSGAFSVLFQQQLCSFQCSTPRVMQCRLDDWLGN